MTLGTAKSLEVTAPALGTEFRNLLSSPRFKSAKNELLQCILEASSKVSAMRPASNATRDLYMKTLEDFAKNRGRDLYYPFLSSGLGHGPFVELLDGSVKLDMISGIGVNFFGHTHPELISEMIDGLSSDTMQGVLQPGDEVRELIQTVLSKVGTSSRLKHGWLMCSGTMVNEFALKLIRHKHAPATKILAFNDCFAGRSTAMQEITDTPAYREGQPVYGEVHYLPFYDARQGQTASTSETLRVMKETLQRYPGKFAALMIELVQGEGGFKVAPRDFYVQVFELAKKAGLAVWVDEIQTFGRTGEYFAYQKLELAQYMDVVTIGKMLQTCMLLFADEYKPKPALIGATFSGSTMALRTGRKIVEMLHSGGFLGKDGKIEKLSGRFTEHLRALEKQTVNGRKLVTEVRAIGGMIAFMPFNGTMNEIKTILMKLFDAGMVAFYCGHDPYLIRLLPPLGAMDETSIDQACALIKTVLSSVAEDAPK